jgi:hypothetical protein
MGSCTSSTVVEATVDDKIAAAISVSKDMISGHGTVEQVDEYAKIVNMDKANTDAMKVFVTQGPQTGIKFVMTNPHSGKEWSYAESRGMYG